MTKDQLVARLAERMASTKTQAAEIVTAQFAPLGHLTVIMVLFALQALG